MNGETFAFNPDEFINYGLEDRSKPRRIDVGPGIEPADCPHCGRDSCDGGCGGAATRAVKVDAPGPGPGRVDRARLRTAAELVAAGQRIIRDGVPYVVEGVIPAYGMLGFFVGYAKLGKSSTAFPLVRAVSTGAEFLGRRTSRRRVLYLGLEDPEEYMAWLAARALDGTEDVLFYCGSLSLNDLTLSEVEDLIRGERIGFVYISTFAAGVRELVRDENDNAGLSRVVETLKASARRSSVPYLFEAHAGKGEDQSPDADPVRALRGASAAAASADFVLSLKRDGSGLTTRRMLSGAGRFVDFPPLAFDYAPGTGALEYRGEQREASTESTALLIRETGALSETEPRSATAVLLAAGATDNGHTRYEFRRALESMPDVEKTVTRGLGGKTARYRLVATEGSK